MSTAAVSLLSALIGGGISLVGVLIANSRAMAVMEEKIAELTREVRAHNNFAQRMPVVEEQIKHQRDVAIQKQDLRAGGIPRVLLLIQAVAAVFGFTLDLGDIGNKLIAVVNAAFGVLVVLGVVVDPTTAGIADSKQARGYNFPKED